MVTHTHSGILISILCRGVGGSESNMKFIMLSNFDCRKSVDKQSVVDSQTWSVNGENASFDHRVINHFGCVDSVRLTWIHLEWRYFRSCWYVVQCSLLLLYNYYYIIIVFITLFMHDDAHCWVMCIIGRESVCVCIISDWLSEWLGLSSHWSELMTLV